jgi:hypothetical protein
MPQRGDPYGLTRADRSIHIPNLGNSCVSPYNVLVLPWQPRALLSAVQKAHPSHYLLQILARHLHRHLESGSGKSWNVSTISRMVPEGSETLPVINGSIGMEKSQINVFMESLECIRERETPGAAPWAIVGRMGPTPTSAPWGAFESFPLGRFGEAESTPDFASPLSRFGGGGGGELRLNSCSP